ncbi:MAG: MFS transporter [Sphingobium sp.]|nr:MFS transporter [Sphingobium sp.]MBP9158522.1 MFS transporter [Sphingobium sp.]
MAWLTVAILFILYIRSLADRYLIALVVEPIKQNLGLSDFQISLLQGPAFAVLYCLCAIPLGLALDKHSRRWVLFLCVAVWSMGAAGCGLAGSFAVLAIARSMVGAGESGFSTGAYSIVGDSFPPERVSLAMSIFVMGGVMGAGIVFLLGGPLVGVILNGGVAAWPFMSDFQPWQQAFIITGLPGVLMALMIFLFPEPPRHHIRKVTDSTGYGDALRFIGSHRRLFVGIFIGFGLVYTCTISLQLWLPSYFVRVHGWTPGRIGIVLGIAQISAALSLPVHGWIVDRFYQRGMRDAHLYWCILSVCLAGPCAVAALLIPNPWMTVILFALYMMFVLSSASMGPAVTQVVTPQHLRGRVSAIYVLTTGLIAMSVGPAAVGFFTDKIFGDPRAVGLSLIAVILGALIPATLLFAWGRGQMRRLLQSTETSS